MEMLLLKKGDTLFTYKNDQVQSQVEQLELQLNSAKSQKKKKLINKMQKQKKKTIRGFKESRIRKSNASRRSNT